MGNLTAAGSWFVRRIVLAFAAAASVSVALSMSVAQPARAEFGIAAFDQQITSDAAGDTFIQAGGHPYAIKTEIDLNSHPDPAWRNLPRPNQDPKDLITELPPGLFGNPVGLPQCTMQQLAGARINGVLPEPLCPVGSQVGTIQLRFESFPGSPPGPLYNMVPPAGQPAAFAFNIAGILIVLTGNVRNGGDFGVNVVSSNIPTTLPLDGITLTFWGVPADPSHDTERFCARGTGGPCVDPDPKKAFLTMPTSCVPVGVGLSTTLLADSWQNPGVFVERELLSHVAPGYPLAPSEWGAQQGTSNCGVVPFDPSVRVEPTNHQADTPTGLNIDFKLPQEGLLNPEGVATADVRKTVVTLPGGISVSPSAANGLGACSLEQIGLNNGSEPACPDSSKLGSVEIDSPLMGVPLEGSIYLAKQDENPFGSLMAIYLAAKAHGVQIKLAGRIDLDPVTGQLVTTVENSPQLPFDDLKVDFKGGPRSPLVNPHTCGTYTATAEMTPWSGSPSAHIQGSFDITTGPDGAMCPNALQFAPGFSIGTTNNQAGAFSPLSITFTRADGDQQLGANTVHTPTGLFGMLSTVALCPEPQASLGTCGPESQIGTITAASGAGPNPFYVTGGKVFLTGPYKGAPFGLSDVVPAKAGPFDLGTIVVRSAIRVDPHTAALTTTTEALPTILQGIPLDLRLVNVSIDRPGFIFNPTNCEPQEITGTLTGGQGLIEPVRSSFQVTNCGVLGFKPSFSASTNGKTSRANGASLDVKLSFPKDALGKQSNVAKVKVDLPKKLPSRLETLQKACSGEVFQANPAGCPAASKIGTATATTPILPVPLSGPMYFVSHGGQAWPDLVIVLEGYNVTVQLVGNTFINQKTGITSTTFNTIPDVPVGTFQLKLPQGRYSALAANGNLCNATLTMPTLFIAQDGAIIKQTTPITAMGCPKHKAHREQIRGKRKHKKK